MLANLFFRLLLALGLIASLAAAPAAARELRVGVYANSPKIFIDKDGKPSGILVELLDKIAQQEG